MHGSRRSLSLVPIFEFVFWPKILLNFEDVLLWSRILIFHLIMQATQDFVELIFSSSVNFF